MRRTARVVLALLAGLGAAGCRNPFSPQADIELAHIYDASDSARFELRVQRQTPPIQEWVYTTFGMAVPIFIVKNKVGVNITKVNIVYTDLAGNPVTTYRTTGGKTFRVLWHMDPRFDFTNSYGGEGVGWGFGIVVLDGNVYTELANQVGDTKAVIAHLTFWGEDDNGYDVKLTGAITIKGFGF